MGEGRKEPQGKGGMEKPPGETRIRHEIDQKAGAAPGHAWTRPGQGQTTRWQVTA